ncbi:MAG: magnesium/cobalt transporter CorA [Armatimonadota bacterium]|nr:magnesium/cobalt transporter CorA [Armatimonadota bacterium]
MKRSRKKRRSHLPVSPGAPPGSLTPSPGIVGDTTITLIAYDGEIRETEATSIEDVRNALSDCRVLWVDVDGLGDVGIIAQLGELFNLHPLTLEDVVNQNQRSKVEEYPENYFIVVHAPKLMGHDLSADQLSLFLGANYVITFHHRMEQQLAPVKQNLRKRKLKITEYGSDFLAYSILDSVVDQYFPILEQFGELTDDAEDQMLLDPKTSTVGYVHGLKRELLDLRRAIWPFRDALAVLIRDDETPLISSETRPYFRDLYDHTVRVIDLVETYREVTSDLMDIYLSSVSNRTNDVMKRLTAITTIIMPLTLITGIYGMNFEFLPETQYRYGYFIVMAIMAIIAVSLFVFFWRQGWIAIDREDDKL